MADKNSRLNLIEAQQAKKEQSANALFNAMSNSAFGGLNVYASSGLVWGIYGGAVGGAIIPNTTVTLTDNATNYISFNSSTNSFTVNTSAFDGARCYQVTTSGGIAKDWIDYRPNPLSGSGGSSLALYKEKGTPTVSPRAINNNNIAIGEGAYTEASSYALSIFTNSSQTFYGALGAQSIAVGSQTVAANTGSFAFGNDCQSLAQFAFSFGRVNVIKGGADNASIYGGTNNNINANAQYSTIYGGQGNNINGTNSTILNSYYSTINGNFCTAINNQSSVCAADYMGFFNAIECTAEVTAKYSTVFGFKGKATMPGSFLIGFNDKNQFQKVGLSASTTDATATNMTLFNGAQTYKSLRIANNSAALARINLVCMGSAGNVAAFNLDSVIKMYNGTASIVSTTLMLNKVASNTAAMMWSAQLVLDSTNNVFNIQVTGAASTSIQWSATVDLVQVFI